MKRKTAVFVLTLALAGAMFMTGCGSNAGVEVDASKNEDLSAKVTDQNKVDDNSGAYQKFLDAQKAMEGTDSLTINSELLISLKENNEKEENKQRFEIKRALVDNKQTVEFTMDTVMKKYKEDGTEDEENSHTRSLPGYFHDGMLYYAQPLSDGEGDDAKLKEEIPYEDLMSVIGSSYILNDISADQIETTASEKKGSNTEYIFILDKDAISQYLLDNLSATGMPFGEEGGVDINYANVSAEIDKDGILTAYTLSVDAVIKDETGEVPFTYNIASAFTNANSTNVAVKAEEELADYITTEEYAKKLQQEQAEIENMPVEEGTGEGETGSNIVVTPENAADYGIELTEDQTATVNIGE